MRSRLSIAFPYILFGLIALSVGYDNLARGRVLDVEPAAYAASDEPGTRHDPVCNMEVNPNWGFFAIHDGVRYDFCSARCRDRFVANTAAYLQERCIVCDAPLAGVTPWPATYHGKTYHACTEAHRAAFQADPASYFLHSMWGIPPQMYYVSIAGVLIVSFVGFEWRGRKREVHSAKRSTAATKVAVCSNGFARIQQAFVVEAGAGGVATLAPPKIAAITPPPLRAVPADTSAEPPRLDVFRIWPGLLRALRWAPTRFIAQAGFASMFVLIVAAGLFGNQNPALNIAPLLTWTVWWGGLVLLIMFAGKAWCYVCPWDAFAGWLEKGRLWGKGEGMSLGLKWPGALRNIWPATILFVALTWIELGWGVTMRPRVTAYLALGMFGLAFVCALLFDRQAFCRYGCLVGRVSGLYALFSGMELRARDRQVCRDCSTKDCYRGNERGEGCPTSEFMGAMDLNTYCIMCGECLKTCPEDNIALNLRPWGADLVKKGRPRADEAYLALLMLSITAFHGLTMTPIWQGLIDRLAAFTGLPQSAAFSVGMAAILAGPIAIYAGLVGISRLASTDRSLPYRTYFIRYAYALLPIALFYHLAHNSEHLLMEGPKVVRLLSDPFGWGWNLFGTASLSVPPLVSLGSLWYVQVALVLIGHVYSLWVAEHTATHLFPNRRAAFRSQLPMLAGMVLFSIFSLWLLKQPMLMRSSSM